MKAICISIMAAVILTCCQGKGAQNLKEEKHDEKVECFHFFGVDLKGKDLISIVQEMEKRKNILTFKEKTVEEKEAYVVDFFGIPCGMNIEKKTANDSVYITQLVFCTSQLSGKVFNKWTRGISDYYGNPDIMEDEGLNEGYENYSWLDAGIRVRNIHSEEGGIVAFFVP